MSQTNVDFSDNPTGSELMDNYLAREQENSLTSNSGIQRPSYAKAGTKWLDTSSEPWALKMYTGSGDVVIGYIDKTKGTFTTPLDKDVVHVTGNQTIDGIKTFSKGIVGTFQNYYALNMASNTAPWKKMMNVTVSGQYQTVIIPFLLTGSSSGERGITLGNLCLRVNNQAGVVSTDSTFLVFDYVPSWFKENFDFKLLYKNNQGDGSQALLELWVYVKNAYQGVCLIVLDEKQGGTSKLNRSKITWYDNPTGVASLPSGYSQKDYQFEKYYIRTPDINSNTNEPVTSEWHNNKNKVVTTLPSNPDSNVFYYIPE